MAGLRNIVHKKGSDTGVDFGVDPAKKRCFCGQCNTGAQRHLAGFSELLPITTPSNTRQRGFPFCHVLGEAYFFPIFCFCWRFFLYRVRVCCRRASTTVLQYRKHSTAQRTQSARSKPQSKYMPIRV